MKEHIIQIDSNKYIGCGFCVKDCTGKNISIIDKEARIISQNCLKCGHLAKLI